MFVKVKYKNIKSRTQKYEHGNIMTRLYTTLINTKRDLKCIEPQTFDNIENNFTDSHCKGQNDGINAADSIN